LTWDWDQFLAAALEAGLTVLEFWALTPREVYMALAAATERAIQAHIAQRWAVWHLAVLLRQKRLPQFRQFVRRPPQKPTPKELAAKRADHARIVAAYEAALEKRHE